VEVQTWIDAPPHRVWEIVSDVELMPTMSSELQSVNGSMEPLGPRSERGSLGGASTRRWGSGRPRRT